ncbi:glycosyltransferase [Turicibacter sanguinis]|uniref:glycosyltransferase family 2 protein n=1 Tax=Turicibacter sanguinis TaxID=154288 RepID=UPI0012BC81CC|nr:glycosyltransferase family 2 protein [Turicibacter sanguinis]MDB8545633.1 glycosyltransferase family 2 protein [Turicibacter sanguinis]MTO10805.1 glycosyltransferase [Turicibacter sanguinis]MTP48340.1 glycosyltransferase [Turicibacter sanguinis]MTP51059.1 glycosyltransferase [Turicibacter sanguinis]MTQ08341.1 glycosyltransferase [Turicibacter sanguinis]
MIKKRKAASGLIDKGPIVSVVVATYKREETLRRAIESLAQQTYPNVEIIIVDDNANELWNDKVEKIIERYAHLNRITYIQNKTNQGSASTRNIGIRAAQGEYVTFLDDDDIYLPDKITNQIKHMIDVDSDFSITDLELFSENGIKIEKRTRNYIKNYNKQNLLQYHLMYHMTGTDTMMFKRDYLINIGGFPHINVGDEFYLMQRAIEKGGKFSYLPVCDIKAYVHTETEGLSSGESKIKGENALYEVKKKYFKELDRKAIHYIKMRHYAVLAFAELRRKHYVSFIKNALMSMIASPFECIKLLINR